MSTVASAVPSGPADLAGLLGEVPFYEFANQIIVHPSWEWTWPWWEQGCLIARATSGGLHETWEEKNHRQLVPRNLDRLGCSGHDRHGRLCWVGWDLDVGHGSTHYESLGDALADAQRLREALGEAEIRLSTSGNGAHVRHLLPEDCGLTSKEAGRIAKFVARTLGLRADPSALGRQAHWLWALDPAPRAFEEVAVQTEPVLDLADIIVEGLSSSTAEGERGAWSGVSSYDPLLADDDGEHGAIAHWEPAGEFGGRSPLGDRNWADMRHLVNDWGLSIERAIEILQGRGANVHPDIRQWQRMLRYVRYPQGWARRREERKRHPSRPCSPLGFVAWEGGAL